ILVKFKGLVPNFIASGIIKSAGGEVTDKTNGIGLNVVAVPEDQAEDLIQGLTDNLLVDYAEPNHTARAFYAPNDPGFSDQTNLSVMQVPFAWDVTRGENVIVAVIDTGLDFTHPDLISNLWANPGEMGMDVNGNDKASNGVDDDNDGYVDNWLGWNFVDNNNDLADHNGHGTHSAGVIGAGMDNALGIAGIAPGARILPIKALNDQGYGSYADVARAIVYAVDHGARVINLGFGGQAESQALRDATDYAHQHDAVVVAAAGNGASDAPYYPAANPNVIAALALDPSLALASFSSYGYVYSVGAPGMGIFSTVTGGGTGTLDGSSVSAAEVSGVAALLASRPQFDTADKIRGAIFGSARDLGAAGHDPYFGYGLVQALDALAYNPSAFQTPTPSPTPAGTATPTPTGIPTGVAIQVDAPNADINNYTRS
ncbi:MAG: S8 family serine peptidase, partial [Anaerolineales bacterium]|nr:S8 family serine peptidase [Anaerolineales bacterium]